MNMQKSELQNDKKSDDEHLDTTVVPKSIISLSQSQVDYQTTSNKEQEFPLSDPDIKRKSKVRSRFTSAIRKLSRSTKKKQNSLITQAPLVDTSTIDSVLVSTSDDIDLQIQHPNQEEKVHNLKKKKSISKHFLLTSLKKSKAKLKDNNNINNDENRSFSSLDQATKDFSETISSETSNYTVDKISTKSLNAISTKDVKTEISKPNDYFSTVQITIRGKKLEQSEYISTDFPKYSIEETDPFCDTNCITSKKQIERVSQSVVKETLPSPVISPSKILFTDKIKNNEKKLKSKKNLSIINSKTFPAKLNTNITQIRTSVAQKAPIQKTFAITQNNQDTPPGEKAPTKPSHIAVNNSEEINQIRKPIQRAAATLTSPSISQHFKTAATVATIVKKKQHTAVKTTREKKLMQHPLRTQLQRDHYLQEPTANVIQKAIVISPHATLNKNQTPSPVLVKKLTPIAIEAKKKPQHLKQNIELHKNSHVSVSQALPSHTLTTKTTRTIATVEPTPASALTNATKAEITVTTTTENKNEIQNHIQSADSSKDLTLQISPYLSSPIPKTPYNPIAYSCATSDVLDIVNPKEVNSHYTPDELFIKRNSSEQNNIVCTDKFSILSEDSIRNFNIPSHKSQDFPLTVVNDSIVELSTAVSFSVGSAVRAQETSIDLLHEEYSFDSNKTSDTQSPLSETSRKRIHYIAQPTISDELTSFEVEKNAYQTGFTCEYSLDSEYDSDDHFMPAFGDLTMDQDMEPTVMTSISTEKREHLYKILVIGELGTGKTSFIKRYVHQFFSQNYRATIGVDFALKVLNWDSNTIVRLQLWDIAGQERFGNMTRVYYKEAVGAFIVFDVTRGGTFDCVSKWKEDLDSKVQLPDGNPIPCILLANKCDQEKQGIVTLPEKMDDYVNLNGFAGWFETSAKENINIDAAAKALVNKILLNDKLTNATNSADSEMFNLNTAAEKSDADLKSKCFC